ncbi:MAG: glycerol-3-phosphate 1-O-acyltransferase PlsY [Bacillota bacterium]
MDLLIIFISYLLGSIPFGYLVGRRLGVDIRRLGSGNTGATNALRVLGPIPALITAIADVGKGLVAVYLARRFGVQTDCLPYLAGLAAMAGHNWSVFLRFGGGKGVATGAGITGALVPTALPYAVAVFVATIFLTRYVSLGSILAAATIPVAAWLTGADRMGVVFGLVLAATVIFQHRGNIQRLLAGNERKFGQKVEKGQ